MKSKVLYLIIKSIAFMLSVISKKTSDAVLARIIGYHPTMIHLEDLFEEYWEADEFEKCELTLKEMDKLFLNSLLKIGLEARLSMLFFLKEEGAT